MQGRDIGLEGNMLNRELEKLQGKTVYDTPMFLMTMSSDIDATFLSLY